MRKPSIAPETILLETIVPEKEFLVQCTRVDQDSRRLEALLAQSLDWHSILDGASRHGILPLVALRLQGHDLPPAAAERLNRQLRESTARNLSGSAELLAVLDVLQTNGISAVPLKGPVLAMRLYGSIAWREFDDLDILIPRKDTAKAASVLQSHGYRPGLDLSAMSARAFAGTNCEMTFEKPGSSRPIEIHWGFQERKFLGRSLNSEAWWDRLESMYFFGHSVQVPALDDLLIFLCAHGAKHSWGRLKWIRDIAELVSLHPAEAWESTLQYARELRLERVLLLGLLLASDLLGAALPGSVQGAVASERRIGVLAAQVGQRLKGPSAGSLGIFGTSLFHLQLGGHLWDRLRYFGQNLLVPTAGEWQLIDLPGPLSFLYYPLRPLRLLAGYGVKRIFAPSARAPLPGLESSVINKK